MQRTIIKDLEYVFNKGDLSKIQNTADCKSMFSSKSFTQQISLFSDLEEADQDVNFYELLKCFDHSLHFIKSIRGNSIIWQCYIENQNLAAFSHNLTLNDLFDYLVWPKNCFAIPKLIVFDMDSTFIQIEVIDELAKSYNVGDQVLQVTESAMRGELDFSESLITRVKYLKGLTSSSIELLANSLPLSKGVRKLIAWAHSQDIKIAIVSGGFMPFVDKLKIQLDLYRVKANTLEIEQYKLTGKVMGKIVDARAKADFVNKLKGDLKLQSNQIMSVGDGANDLLMMKETGFSLAYRAKPAVDKEARGRMKTTYLDRLIHVFTN